MDFTSQTEFNFFVVVLIIALGALIITRKLLKVEFPFFFTGVLGAIVGLLVGSLIGKSLDFLPGVYGKYLPLVIQVLVAVAIFDLFMAQSYQINKFFSKIGENKLGEYFPEIIVDTSVLIDGRIDEIASSGFLYGRMIIPKFVLLELQTLADSSDDLKRVRGRKGLDILSDLQRNRKVMMEISEDKVKEKEKVDEKLVRLAKERKAKILTIDYNLNKVAQIQGIEVLNLNDLALAARSQLVPGEEIKVKVVQKGKEKKQGVGYLDDGTMVIVEGGDKFVGENLPCNVIRIYQVTSGKMIFVEPK